VPLLGLFVGTCEQGPALDSISPRSSEKDDDDEARMTNDE